MAATIADHTALSPVDAFFGDSVAIIAGLAFTLIGKAITTIGRRTGYLCAVGRTHGTRRFPVGAGLRDSIAIVTGFVAFHLIVAADGGGRGWVCSVARV